MFGVIFDSTCLFWQFDCGRRGNCWVYNNTALSYRALALSLSGAMLNLIFSFFSWLTYPKNTSDKKPVLSEETNSQNNDGIGTTTLPVASISTEHPTSRSTERAVEEWDNSHIDDAIPSLADDSQR